MAGASDEKGAHFKGNLGVGVRKSIKDLLLEHGRDRDRFVAGLPADQSWFLTEHYIATMWYPLRGAERLLEAVAREVGADPLEVARRIGKDVAFANAGRVGRTVIAIFGTPTRVARHIHSMWGQMYDGGDVSAEYTAADGLLRVYRGNWAPHHPVLCATLLGSLECIAEHMTGFRLRDAKTAACVSHGASRCCFELRFESS